MVELFVVNHTEKKINNIKNIYTVKDPTLEIITFSYVTDEDIEKLELELKNETQRQKTFDTEVSKCLNAIELEKKGKTEEAFKQFEDLIEANFDGNHPYERMANVYRQQDRIDDEIRVLEKAIWVFTNVVNKERGDRILKLENFKTRLIKAKEIKKEK